MNHQCPDIRLLLTEFAADELPAAEAATVAGHLAVCESCRDELTREMALREALSTLPVQSAPRVTLPLHTATRSPATAPSRPWKPLLTGLAAAVLALAVLVPDAPHDLPDRVIITPYTPAQVAQARHDARVSLALAVDIINRTQRHTVVDVFGRQLPQAVSGSLSGTAASPEGGQG